MAQTNIHIDLINSAKTGDNDAMSTLYSLYSKALLNTAYRIVNNVEDAEDVLQDSFIKAFSNLHQFQFKSTFGAWMKRIVINKSIDFIKIRNRLSFSEVHDNIEINEPSIVDDSDDVKDKLDQIHYAIHHLPVGYRTVLSLFLIEGYDHQEISEILNIGVSTSISQLSRAKKKLLVIMQNITI